MDAPYTKQITLLIFLYFDMFMKIQRIFIIYILVVQNMCFIIKGKMLEV